MATVVLAPEPLTRYALAQTVEARFGGENGVLRTKAQHAYDQVPGLEAAGLIRKVGTVPTRGGNKEETSLWAATPAGVREWRDWLLSPIPMPNAMTAAMTRLKAVRRHDHPMMLQIIDRLEATLQTVVHQAIDPGEPEGIADRGELLWNKRVLVAQLQWCQHMRDFVDDETGGTAS